MSQTPTIVLAPSPLGYGCSLYGFPYYMNCAARWTINQTNPNRLDYDYATALSGVAAQVLQKIAHTEIVTQIVQGVEFSAANFRVVEDQLRVEVCFQLPTSEDWLIYNAIARVGDKEILYSESHAIETSRTLENGQKQTISYPGESTGVAVLKATEEEAKGLPDYRCDTISFQLEKDMVVSNVTLVLGAIVMSERKGHGCETYLENVQSILNAEKTGIRLDCVKQEGGDVTSIAEKNCLHE